MLELLGAALDLELAALARTKRCYFAALEAKDPRGREVLLEQAAAQAVHADELAERIAELGGAPDYAASLAVPLGGGVREEGPGAAAQRLRLTLEAEVAAKARALAAHRGILAALGEGDGRARMILTGIAAREEAHARALQRLLAEG